MEEAKCTQCKGDTLTSTGSHTDSDSVSGRREACLKCKQLNDKPRMDSNPEGTVGKTPEKMPIEDNSDTTKDSDDLDRARAKSSFDSPLPKIVDESKRRFSDNIKLKRSGSFRVPTTKRPVPLKDPAGKDGISDLCGDHSGKVMEYYCTSHHEVLCSVCMSLNHIECTSNKCVQYIPNFVKTIPIQINIKENIAEISELITTCRDQKDASTQKLSNLIDTIKILTEEIKDFRKRMNEHLNELEESILKETQLLKDRTSERLMKKCDEFETAMKDLKNLSFELVKCHQSRNDAQSFVITRKAEKEIKKHKRKSRASDGEEMLPEYFFDADTRLVSLLDSVQMFGKVKKRQQLKAMDLKHGGELNVRSKDDKKDSWITGLAVVSDERVVLADFDNQMVKLIDTTHNIVRASLRLPSRPHEVAKFKTNQTAITLPDRQKLILISIDNDEFCVERSVNVNGKCYGLAVHPDQNRFVITLLEPARVQIIQTDGSLVREISKDSSNYPLFSCPEYVCVSMDGNKIYVSDYDRDSVSVLNTEGRVLNVFKNTECKKVLEGPKAMRVSLDGYVYVCGSDSNNVLMLTDDCEKYKVILTSTDGLLNPVCFGEARTGDKTVLYVNGGLTGLKTFSY